MALTLARNNRASSYGNVWNFFLYTLPLYAISFFGCNNTCFSFTSNPPTGTLNVKISDPAPTCKFTRANGAVRVVAHALCGSCSPSSQVRRVVLTLQGVALHPNAMTNDASPEWEELLPQLSGQPVQMELMNGGDGPVTQHSLGETTLIPAGIYRQIRLRLAPNEPTSSHIFPERNACGAAGFHCVILDDGRIRPLSLSGAAPELRITSDRISGGSFLVLPDSNADLVLEFSLSWSLVNSEGTSVHPLPALTVSASVERQAASLD